MFRVFIRNISTSNIMHMTIKPPIPVFGIEGRYVTALFSAASQAKELDGVEKSLRALQKELTKPKIRDFIETSVISRAKKSSMLKDIAKAAGMPNTAVNFLGLAAENGRLKLLNKIVRLFLTVMVAHRKEVLCEVITAFPLQADHKNALMSALQTLVKGDQKIQLTERVDKSIIGGIIVGVADKHIDLSLAHKIQFYSEILRKSV